MATFFSKCRDAPVWIGSDHGYDALLLFFPTPDCGPSFRHLPVPPPPEVISSYFGWRIKPPFYFFTPFKIFPAFPKPVHRLSSPRFFDRRRVYESCPPPSLNGRCPSTAFMRLSIVLDSFLSAYFFCVGAFFLPFPPPQLKAPAPPKSSKVSCVFPISRNLVAFSPGNLHNPPCLFADVPPS